MRDRSATLWRVLHEDAPLIVVIYHDTQQRQDLMDQIELLAPERARIHRTDDVETAFSMPEALLLLTPSIEPAALRLLGGRHEALLSREVPAVFFLLRGGDALRELRNIEMAGLASWLRGRIIDPETLDAVHLDAERASFIEEVGEPPEQWLRQWRAGQLDDTLDHNLIAHRAAVLVEEPGA